MSSTQTIEVCRWYRYWMPDGTPLELKTMDGTSFIDRDGAIHNVDVLRALHASKPTESLESDLGWLT